MTPFFSAQNFGFWSKNPIFAPAESLPSPATLRSGPLFLGPKFRFLVQKSDFCHTTPILVNDPFLALGMTVNFPPWDRFFDFPFRSYSSFCKKIRLTCQKVLPLPTVGAPSASNSPGPRASRMGWINILTAKVFYCFKNEKV